MIMTFTVTGMYHLILSKEKKFLLVQINILAAIASVTRKRITIIQQLNFNQLSNGRFI